MKLRIATRGSKLALWQAEHVRSRLLEGEPLLEVELVVLSTAGDRTQALGDRPLSEAGGKGLFVKEIEAALLDGRADVAVHSMKDLPAEIPAGLALTAVPEREDPRDALLLRRDLGAPPRSHRPVPELPEGARVGTSSLRRVCILRAARPDLDVVSLRGNVDTRIAKLEAGTLDAIVLAVAGLRRLGLEGRITRALSTEESLPAIGQGALAIETRAGDPEAGPRVARLDHREARVATTAERAFLVRLDGSCRTPMAAHAIVKGDRLVLEGLVGRTDGREILRSRLEGPVGESAAIGTRLAELLIDRGASLILAAARAEAASIARG